MRVIKFRLISEGKEVGRVKLLPNGIIDVAYHWDHADQFTGLLDKNGKEIYEGDIVQCNPEVKYYRTVIWAGGEYLLTDGKSNYHIGVINSSHPDTIVVGNVYENPELLEGK